MAILVIDLDGFSAINSEFGRAAGDSLLQAVARRLEGCTRQSDTLCRLGGDQFAVLVEQVKSSRALQPLLKKIIATLSRPENIDGARCCVAVSMGVALYPEDGAGAAELLSRADEARYAVKRSHKKTFGFTSAREVLPGS